MNQLSHEADEAERTPEQLAWDGIVQTIKILGEEYYSESKSITSWSVRLDNRYSLIMSSFQGNIERIEFCDTVFNDPCDTKVPENAREAHMAETITVFFSNETESPNEFRLSTIIGPISFDNGIRRGKDRKSMKFDLHMKQEFSTDGSPKRFTERQTRKGYAELRIEGNIFKWGTHTAGINSYSCYDIADSKLVPISDAVSGLTRHNIQLVHEIISSDRIQSLPISETLEVIPTDNKPQCTVRVFEETLEVFFEGRRIGDVRIAPHLDPLEKVSNFVAAYQDSFKNTTKIIQNVINETIADEEILATARAQAENMRTWIAGHIYGKIFKKNPSLMNKYGSMKLHELINENLPKEIA